MDSSLKKLIGLGVLVEVGIFAACSFLYESNAELFKYAARYSGRFSLLIFLIAFYLYTTSKKSTLAEDVKLINFIKLFAIVHIIHFGFLVTNIYLNNIPLEIPKLIGGALAYLMIVIAPFKLEKVTLKWQLLYFLYVSIVMIMTYVARIKGDFEGAEPFWFHYVALGILFTALVAFGILIYKKQKKPLV